MAYLVGRRVLAEPNVPMNAKDEILDRKLRDREVHFGNLLRDRLDERLPIL